MFRFSASTNVNGRAFRCPLRIGRLRAGVSSIALALAGALNAAPAAAAIYTFAGDGDFWNGANWIGGSAPPQSDSTTFNVIDIGRSAILSYVPSGAGVAGSFLLNQDANLTVSGQNTTLAGARDVNACSHLVHTPLCKLTIGNPSLLRSDASFGVSIRRAECRQHRTSP